MLAQSVWILTLLCLAVLAPVFGYVISRSTEECDYAEVQRNWYSIRAKWFLFLVVFGVGVTATTLLPYPLPPQFSATDGASPVNVIGQQWYWTIDDTEYDVGETIEFRVTSADSTHGFGIYDESGTLLTQTQAMPKYTNRLVYTFDKPGTYKVLCLEYCGLAHHAMTAQLTVK
ncbi:hypothetical protein ACMXYN_00785 [Neptuniibacter sp. PT8_73]|uniref:hypothetical protein n=1 Tax=Neptuniibacter sp. PT8_73 TaxID=3398206 RepID=UPI0039F61B71